MRKVWIILDIVLFAVIVFVLSYPRIQAAKIKEIKIVHYRSINALPVYVAMENGYFDSLKLKVTLEETEKLGDEVERVGRGAFGAGAGTYWDIFALKASASPEIFRIVYNTKSSIDNPQYALVAPKNKPVKSFRDLSRKGIKIGYLKDSRQADMLRYIFTNEKIKEDNYSLVALTQAEMMDTMSLRFVDALLVTEPYRTYLIKKNLVNLVEDGILEKRVMAPFLCGVGFTSKVNVQLNQEGVRRFAEALSMAIDFIRKEPQKSQEILRKYMELQDTFSVNIPVFEKYTEITDVAEIDRTIQKYIEMQLMFREVSFNNSILRKEEIQK
ncbi:MAG: ABC transporter substrate-binding protein [bacterium]|nr:ABC transporter substrate-binding protein [bacterium]